MAEAISLAPFLGEQSPNCRACRPYCRPDDGAGAAERGDRREHYWRELLAEIDRQIHPDGVGAEQAPAYTAFAIELFLVAALAYGKQRDLPAATKDRLAAWAEHALWLMDTDGKVPAIGDADDCRVIATTQAREPRYVASIVSAVASCLDRPDLAPPRTDPSLRDMLFGSMEASPNERLGLRSFPAGGYSVFRGKGEAPAVLTFDHGPVGYLSIAAHGHADTLAVWLTVGDQPIFVDAGTYRYHSPKSLRDACAHTAVHNTLTLRGHPSSRPSGLFNWATKAEGRCIASEDGPTARVVAEHDGYVARFGLRHRRTVAFDGIGRFTITDELLGASDERRSPSPSCSILLRSGDRTGWQPADRRGRRPLARLTSAGPLKAASFAATRYQISAGCRRRSVFVFLPIRFFSRAISITPSVVTVTLLV